MKHPAFVCCAVSFLFLGATSVQAQETSDLTDVHFYPPSAVSMMKYIDYPVSHRTGIPEISIPLYTVRSGSLELPVNLSFHLDDFTRVNQLAGAAGAGWSLSCDMQVSRIINGVDDLKTTGYLHTGISKPDITSTTLVRSTTDRMRLLWRKGADEDPDRFYYKLLNGGGSFYIERELGPKTVPVTGDRIVFDELGTETFFITGTDGTIYHFSSAVADTASEIPSDIKSKTAWKCTEIESADGGSSITFSYLPYRSRVLQTPGSVSLYDRGELYTTNDEVRYAARYPREERYGSIIYSCTLLFGWDDEGYGPTNFFWKELPDQPENSSTVSKWVESHYIDRITFRGGYAQFEYEAYDDTRTRILNPVLERIVICDTQGVARQTIVFTQSNVDQRYERYLQSVQIGNDTYSFSYGMQHIGDAIADFWGYGYRGHYSGGSADVPCHKVLLDLGTDPVDMYGDKLTYPGDYFQREFSMPSNSFPDEIYRTPDEEKRLLSITYPTGGRTEFVCDHNCFRDGEDAVRRISSYRIKYIRYYDTDDTLLKETAYKYGPGEDGCGIIRHEPDMDDDMGNCHTEQTVSYYYPRDSWSGSYSLGATLRLRTYYPHTIYRTNYDDGSHVQYDEVAEYQSAGGTLSGKTVYKYALTNRHARPVREVFAYPNAPYPVEGDTWYLGQLDSVVQYKYDGGRFDWVARRAYTYNRYDASERIFCARVWGSAVGYMLRSRSTTAIRSKTPQTVSLRVACSFRRRLSSSAKTTDASCADGRTIITTRIPIPPAARRRPTPTDEPSPSGRSTPKTTCRRACRRCSIATFSRSRSNGSSTPTRPSRTAIRSTTISTGVPTASRRWLRSTSRPHRSASRTAALRAGKAPIRPTRITSDGRRCATTPTATFARCRPWDSLRSVICGATRVSTSWPKSATPHTTR